MSVRADILAGAIDLHVHAGPDVVERAQGAWAVAEAALAAGCDIVYFPTFGARHQIAVEGAGAMPYPLEDGFVGDGLEGNEGAVRRIVELMAASGAVLATGHLAPEESMVLLEMAQEAGVRQSLVTHASAPVPGMTVEVQRRCVALGGMIEHCLMACTACCSPPVPLEEMARQIRVVGVEHVVVSSDFGQVSNGPPVGAFGESLEALMGCGFSLEEMRRMVVENPRRCVERS